MASAPPPKKSAFANLPNLLTVGRFVLAVVLFVLIGIRNQWIACLVLFALASFTDWLDGYLARKYHLTSALGRNLDPLVDKLLVCGAYIFLQAVDNSGLYPWMTAVIVGRELAITGLRSFLETSGAKFGADQLGKIKMGLQCAALLVIFLVLELLRQGETIGAAWFWVRDGLIYATLVLTVVSGLQYMWRALGMMKNVP